MRVRNDPPDPDEQRELRPQTVAGLVEELDKIRKDGGVLAALEQLAAGLDNPTYQGPTFEELFGTEQGIEVFGRLFPKDIPGLAEERLDAAWLKGPARAVARNKRRLAKIVEQLKKAEEDFVKRSERRASALVRKVKGGSKRLREFLQHNRLADLNLFAEGESVNRLKVGSNRLPTELYLGTRLSPVTVDLSGELSLFEGDPADAGALEPLFHRKLVELSSTVIDHSHALAMLVGEAVGHTRIERTLTLDLTINVRGHHYQARQQVMSGHRTKKASPRSTSVQPLEIAADDALPEGKAHLTVKLSYGFRLPKSRIEQVLDALSYITPFQVLLGGTAARQLMDEDLLDDELAAGESDTAMVEPIGERDALAAQHEAGQAANCERPAGPAHRIGESLGPQTPASLPANQPDPGPTASRGAHEPVAGALPASSAASAEPGRSEDAPERENPGREELTDPFAFPFD